MKIVDTNVLLYAVNERDSHHRASVSWLDQALNGSDVIGFAWIALLGFVRLATRPGIFARPLSVDEALGQVAAWTAAPAAIAVQPGSEHHRLLAGLLTKAGTGGNLVNDAHLAALALERRASMVSYDADFARFPGVRCVRPDDLLLS